MPRWKKRNRKPKRRFVYLMERIRGRTWKTIFLGLREIKIGVSIDVEKRLKEVNRSIKGKTILIYKVKVNKATTVESFLHRQYGRHNFKLDGDGGTEFFRLNRKQINNIKRFLTKKNVQKESDFFWSLIFVIALFILLVLLES